MKTPCLSLKSFVVLTLVLLFVTVGSAVAGADLEASVTGISSMPSDSTFHPGDHFRVRSIIKNIGDETSENFTIYFYVGDYSLGSESCWGLASQEFDLSGVTFTMPDDAPYGEYTVRIEVSCSDDINPDNNEASDDRSFIYAEKPPSDLEALGVSEEYAPADGLYHQGETIWLRGRVINHSDESASEFTIEYYVGDYSVGSKSRSWLGSGETDEWSYSFSLPSDIPYGNHTLRIEIFYSNDSTPDNNEASGAEITIAEKGPPDLWISNFRVPDNLYYGSDSLTVRCSVENIGHSDSDSYTVDFYIGDDKLGSENRDGIVGHGSDEWFPSTITLPYDFPEGTHLITAELTCSDDSDPGNNSAEGSITVGKSIPTTISIESVDATDGIYRPGEPIVVRIVIEGVGGHLDTGFEVDVYASADAEITSSDYKIHSYDSQTASPEESDLLFEACQLPSDIPVGDYYIGIIVTYPVEDGTESQQACDYNTVYIGGCSDLYVQSVGITPGAYLPGEEFIVYSLIENVGDRLSDSYTVDYYASTDATITQGDYHVGYVNRGDLPPGEQHSYNTTCQFPPNIPAGNYYIGMIVTCPRDYDPTNNVGCDSATAEVVHPAGYVCGQMKYEDIDGCEHPIRYALIEIYDDDNNDDPLDDRVIGRTHTDHNGNYGVIVLNGEDSSQEIYVKVFTEGFSGAYPEARSKICSVRDDVFDESYRYQSPPYLHPQDSSVVVNMTTHSYNGVYMVYDSVVEGFHKARTFFGIEPGEITIYWPCSEGSSYYIPSEGIFIARYDRGDRDVIMHEYGHYIAEIYGFAQGAVGDNPIHYWDRDLRAYPEYRTDEHARNLAFREAWPTLFGIATQYGDTWYPNSGDTKYQDLDEPSGYTFEIDLEEDTYSHKSPGQYYEHMNCCALWDIFDDNSAPADHNDTLSDTSLSKIWTISRYCRPDNIMGFWNGWFARFDYADEMTCIFEDHDMPFTIDAVEPNCICEAIYVDDDAPGDPGPNDPNISDPNEDGTLDHPFDLIQEAVDAAVDGLTVVVFDGIYCENVDLAGKNIILTGADANDPNIIANTVIDGNGLDSVLTFTNGESTDCVLQGFTITNGFAEFGGGARCEGSSPTIVRCTFTGNWADCGGGLANLSGSPTLIGCTFTANRAQSGGAVYNAGQHGIWRTLLINCAFSGNLAEDAGGGMYNEDANVGLANCTFAGNWAPAGRALACDSGEQLNPTDVQLSNCILWDGPDEAWNSGGSILTISYCDVQGGQVSVYDPCEGLVWEDGNIDADPCFVLAGCWADVSDMNIPAEPNDPNAIWIDGDYHLLVGSPCIDAGDSNAVPLDTTDLDGDGDVNEPAPWDLDGICRFVDDPASWDIGNGTPPIVDMGACEYMPPAHLVAVKVIARPQPSDWAAMTPPDHQAAYNERQTFYVELWAQVAYPPAGSNGLCGVFGDVAFDGSIVSAESVEHCAGFATFSSGTIEPDMIDELGGCTLTGGSAVSPQWALVARIKMTACAQGRTNISLSVADTDCSIIGYGLVPPEQIALESCQVTVGAVSTTCIYDLDGDGTIGPGDLALFACFWLQSVSDSNDDGLVTSGECDFDGDGFVGPGDASWFATGWLKSWDDPSIQYPPDESEPTAFRMLFAAAPGAVDVEVRSAIVTSPSASDSTEILPASISSVSQGQGYYVEVWASDVGGTNMGLTSVYVNLDMSAGGSASIQSIDHGGIFTVFASGTIRAGGIEDLGGSSLAAAGIEPQWVRVATVKMRAEASGPVACSLAPSTPGIAALGRGLVPWSQIALGMLRKL